MIKKLLKPINLGKIFNVPILFGPSATLISIFWIWLFYFYSDKHNLLNLLTAILVPIVLFGSVTIHEFGHILMARKYDINTKRIDLFMFGGCALIESEPKTASSNFLVAIMGPLVSLFLFLIGYVFNLFLPETIVLTETLKFFNHINFVLFIFNMCFVILPFDGGRIVHSIIWFFTKDKRKALKISYKFGEYILYFLVGLSIASLIIHVPYFGHGVGAFINIIIIIIGYLMMTSAKNGQMPHI